MFECCGCSDGLFEELYSLTVCPITCMLHWSWGGGVGWLRPGRNCISLKRSESKIL